MERRANEGERSQKRNERGKNGKTELLNLKVAINETVEQKVNAGSCASSGPIYTQISTIKCATFRFTN